MEGKFGLVGTNSHKISKIYANISLYLYFHAWILNLDLKIRMYNT